MSRERFEAWHKETCEGEEVCVTERVIDTHVGSLHRKIETDPGNPRHILSVRGVGYKPSRN